MNNNAQGLAELIDECERLRNSVILNASYLVIHCIEQYGSFGEPTRLAIQLRDLIESKGVYTDKEMEEIEQLRSKFAEVIKNHV